MVLHEFHHDWQEGQHRFRATGQPVSWTQASDAMASRLAALWGEVCATQMLPTGVGPFAFRYQGNAATSANILIPLERQLIALQLCRWQIYIMKLCSKRFFLYCRNLYERRQIYVFDPHFEEVRGGIEPWLMARWKASIWLPIHHNWTFFH